MELRVRNVQEAYFRGVDLVWRMGVLSSTRNGEAYVVQEPVVTVYRSPTERVLLDPRRDANPIFHLMESFWMLTGSNDVKSIGRYIGSLKKYSDDGVVYHGAYGHRWRRHFGVDQLAQIIKRLREDPTDRRIVLQMWDPRTDLLYTGRDAPCNTSIYFRVVNGHSLDMTVCCRSNDAVWGAYGANAVHFSVLQEFVAAACGLRVGTLWQLSNNLHGYADVMHKVSNPEPEQRGLFLDAYAHGIRPVKLFSDQLAEMETEYIFGCLRQFWSNWMSDGLEIFPAETSLLLRDIRRAAKLRKDGHMDAALTTMRHTDQNMDWARACTEWLERRA